MAKHDIKGDKLQINSIESKEESIISIGTPLRYEEGYVFDDPLDIPNKGYVDAATDNAASVAEINTGTDDDKFTTPLGLAGSKYLDQSGSKIYAVATDSVTPDNYTATIVPAITAIVEGQIFYVKFVDANTTYTPTLNLNGLGAISLTKNGDGSNMNIGEIVAGGIYRVAYDGTNFQIDVFNTQNESFIQNQSFVPQNASFDISGTGFVGDLLTADTLAIASTPSTSAGTYDILTRKISGAGAGSVEKVSSNTFIQNQSTIEQDASAKINGTFNSRKTIIDTTGTYTDTGEALQVTGTTSLNGSTNVDGSLFVGTGDTGEVALFNNGNPDGFGVSIRAASDDAPSLIVKNYDNVSTFEVLGNGRVALRIDPETPVSDYDIVVRDPSNGVLQKVDSNIFFLQSNIKYGTTGIITDGSTDVFTIPHGLGSVPSSVSVTFGVNRNSELTTADISVDATNITISCDNPPPPVGTINVFWQVFK